MGTRRKARECALQILFAADVAQTPAKMLAHDYWGDFGFEEVFRGANALAVSVLNELDKFDALAAEAKAVTKKINNVTNVRRLFSEVEHILYTGDKLKKNYRDFIEKFINTEIPEVEIVENEERQLRLSQIEDLYESVREIENEFVSLTSSLSLEIRNNQKFFTENEGKAVEEVQAQARQIAKNLIDSLLPKVSEMIGEIHPTRVFANNIALGALKNLDTVDERIRSRAEHWRISRMAVVDRNVLRLAVYEFLYEETPHTVVINEALEIARRFSTFEATQFINGILDAVKHDLEKNNPAGKKNEEEIKRASTR